MILQVVVFQYMETTAILSFVLFRGASQERLRAIEDERRVRFFFYFSHPFPTYAHLNSNAGLHECIHSQCKYITTLVITVSFSSLLLHVQLRK